MVPGYAFRECVTLKREGVLTVGAGNVEGVDPVNFTIRIRIDTEDQISVSVEHVSVDTLQMSRRGVKHHSRFIRGHVVGDCNGDRPRIAVVVYRVRSPLIPIVMRT